MHYSLTDIQADCEINRPVRERITAKINYFHRRQTDGQTSRTTTIGSFFKKKQDAREAMRVVFFCTYKMYLYAQNEISYEYIQILF